MRFASNRVVCFRHGSPGRFASTRLCGLNPKDLILILKQSRLELEMEKHNWQQIAKPCVLMLIVVCLAMVNSTFIFDILRN